MADPGAVEQEQSGGGGLLRAGEADRSAGRDRKHERDEREQQPESARDTRGEQAEPRAARDDQLAEDASPEVAAPAVAPTRIAATIPICVSSSSEPRRASTPPARPYVAGLVVQEREHP